MPYRIPDTAQNSGDPYVYLDTLALARNLELPFLAFDL